LSIQVYSQDYTGDNTLSIDSNTKADSLSSGLNVGIAGSEPFVFPDGESGIAIDIWEEIAEDKSWDYQYSKYNSVDAAVKALSDNEVDLVIGPISITSARLAEVDFTQPFYNSSISILSRKDDKSLWQRVKPLFSLDLLYAVGVLVLVLAIVGGLLWLAERKASPDQFPQNAIGGIGTGMWLAIVTMTTTGYGDKAPITTKGRIITSIWMIISIVSATSLVAGIASTLSLSSAESDVISNIEQLYGKKAATVAGSTSVLYLKEQNVDVIETDNLMRAVNELNEGKVDAVVYDRPQLLYYMKQNSNDKLSISKAEYYKQGYGFAFPNKSNLDYEVNRTLLELAESQEIRDIIDDYIQKDE
jgi:polar amino acid transport system substrate-binding protein